jgi:radical SAM protein with 4Fe4S-binding SPASM domain
MPSGPLPCPSGFLPKSAGNVREESVVDLYRGSDLFRQLRDRDALHGKCGACPFRQVCGGNRSRAYAYTSDPLASDPLCPYVPPEYDGPPAAVTGDDSFISTCAGVISVMKRTKLIAIVAIVAIAVVALRRRGGGGEDSDEE